MANNNSLGHVYQNMSQQELMNLINQAKSISLGEATEAQKNFAQSVDDQADPERTMRSRFERPAMPMPTPPSSPAGLTATPQVQEKEEDSMFNFSMDDITKYISNIFSSSPPAIEESVSKSKIVEGISEAALPEKRTIKPVRYSEDYSSNNPGNVERLSNDVRAGESVTGGYGKDNRFPTFDHPVMGLRAIFMDINNKVTRHGGDLEKMITEYAPKSENKTSAYLKFVKNKVGKNKKTISSPEDVKKVVEAIVEYENRNLDDGKLVDFYLKDNDFMIEAEGLAKINLPDGTSYKDVSEGRYKVKSATGGRMASNPNPYAARVI